MQPARDEPAAGRVTYQELRGESPLPLPPLTDFNRSACSGAGREIGVADGWVARTRRNRALSSDMIDLQLRPVRQCTVGEIEAAGGLYFHCQPLQVSRWRNARERREFTR
jgi:hypothetical protein